MYEFGDTTNSIREQIISQEAAVRSSALITDDLKNHYQFSTALVLSSRVNEDNSKQTTENGTDNKLDVIEYWVLLERENRKIMATHKKDYSFWSKTSFPTAGDRVTIKHRKDLFQAEIVEILSATYADAIAKYSTLTKKAG